MTSTGGGAMRAVMLAVHHLPSRHHLTHLGLGVRKAQISNMERELKLTTTLTQLPRLSLMGRALMMFPHIPRMESSMLVTAMMLTDCIGHCIKDPKIQNLFRLKISEMLMPRLLTRRGRRLHDCPTSVHRGSLQRCPTNGAWQVTLPLTPTTVRRRCLIQEPLTRPRSPLELLFNGLNMYMFIYIIHHCKR